MYLMMHDWSNWLRIFVCHSTMLTFRRTCYQEFVLTWLLPTGINILSGAETICDNIFIWENATRFLCSMPFVISIVFFPFFRDRIVLSILIIYLTCLGFFFLSKDFKTRTEIKPFCLLINQSTLVRKRREKTSISSTSTVPSCFGKQENCPNSVGTCWTHFLLAIFNIIKILTPPSLLRPFTRW